MVVRLGKENARRPQDLWSREAHHNTSLFSNELIELALEPILVTTASLLEEPKVFLPNFKTSKGLPDSEPTHESNESSRPESSKFGNTTFWSLQQIL
jgi:hypothetical protein